jgi:hypothetical protein
MRMRPSGERRAPRAASGQRSPETRCGGYILDCNTVYNPLNNPHGHDSWGTRLGSQGVCR